MPKKKSVHDKDTSENKGRSKPFKSFNLSNLKPGPAPTPEEIHQRFMECALGGNKVKNSKR